MDFELLQSISLAVAEARRVDTILPMIVSGLVDKGGIALARIWLVGPGDICAHCRMRSECPSQDRCLHLVASAGYSQANTQRWNGIDGEFRRFPLGVRKIGGIGLSGESLHLGDVTTSPDWIVHPEWIERESIQDFVGHPLVYRAEILGVLGVFSRRSISTEQFRWLRIFADQAAVAIANARAFEEIEALRDRLQLENEYLKSEVRENFGGLLGQSASLQKIFRQIELVAPTDANVLILGESGTGKELIARAIHERSKRSARALVKVNCASVPSELFESEFFGHARGAFTGASHDRIGRFQLADNGTLFLDEVGEIPLVMQSKLLRVLQEGEFERVGENRTRRVNVRVIAATNRRLDNELQAGRFRQDLYFRLSVFPLEAPPLRERREDIPLLATHFIKKTASRLNVSVPRLSEANVRQLSHYSWPGNIRELQNVIERAVILSVDGTLSFDLRETATAGKQEPILATPFTRKQFLDLERQTIEEALRKSGGKIYGPGGAAELLGMRPTTVSSKIAALGIKRLLGRKAGRPES
jgi:transcriptional regulator with GAF, ATPase, and Fis domain